MIDRRRAAMSFIFVTVALDMLALGVIIPVWPTLIKSFTGLNDSQASLAIGEMSVLFAATQFFAAPVLGVLSDRFGRRPVILVSNLGTALDYIIMALAPSLAWLYAGRALSGVMSASIPTAYAYVADVTPPEKRAGAYGLISGAFGLGFVVGPALGGWLGGFDPRLPFWVAASLGAANFLYGLIMLAGVAAGAEAPRAFRVGAREPARLAAPPALAPRALRHRGRRVHRIHRARSVSDDLRALRPAPLRLDHGDARHRPCDRRRSRRWW